MADAAVVAKVIGLIALLMLVHTAERKKQLNNGDEAAIDAVIFFIDSLDAIRLI